MRAASDFDMRIWAGVDRRPFTFRRSVLRLNPLWRVGYTDLKSKPSGGNALIWIYSAMTGGISRIGGLCQSGSNWEALGFILPGVSISKAGRL